MGIMTNYQEIVGCCVQGGMPAEYANNHEWVLDWLGDQLQIAAFTGVALTQLREMEAEAVQIQQEVAELQQRIEAVEADVNANHS